MKIAFIGQKGIPSNSGGIEKHVQELSTQLAKAGFDVSVYSRPHYTGNRKQRYQGVNVINLPSFNTKHFDAITHTFFSSLHAIFQSYDIIHYHGVGPSLLSFIPRLFNPKTKVIVTFHCIDRQHQKWNWLAKQFLSLGEWTACTFPHQTITVSEVLYKYCQYRFDKTTNYIPNGVKITRHKADLQILKKFNLKKQGYFLSVSRLVKHKGIHTLIQAYLQLKTDKKLVIVGGSARTNDYVTYLHELAAGNPNIIFTDEQTGRQLETIFKNAYAFVQPSETEGLSITLLEAIAYGLPVITSDIEENQEIAKGLSLEFKSKNVKDLTNKLQQALKDTKVLKAKAKFAKKLITKKYNWLSITKQTIDVYQNQPDASNYLKYKAKSYQY